MLKDLLRKELRQLWLGPQPSSAAEPPAYGQTQAWQARMNGADDHSMASGQRKRHPLSSRRYQNRKWEERTATSVAANPCDVLATARAASGM